MSAEGVFAALNVVDAVFQDELRHGEEIARCPSCSLFITVIYDLVRLLVPAVHEFDVKLSLVPVSFYSFS